MAKGQLPPYPSASKLSDSPCAPQYAASLKCLEEFSKDKNKCQGHFDMYKECMKKEKEARLERNRDTSSSTRYEGFKYICSSMDDKGLSSHGELGRNKQESYAGSTVTRIIGECIYAGDKLKLNLNKTSDRNHLCICYGKVLAYTNAEAALLQMVNKLEESCKPLLIPQKSFSGLNWCTSAPHKSGLWCISNLSPGGRLLECECDGSAYLPEFLLPNRVLQRKGVTPLE